MGLFQLEIFYDSMILSFYDPSFGLQIGVNLNASANVCSMGNKQEELETCTYLQGYYLTGNTET